MAVDLNEVDRTLEETEKTLKMAADLEAQISSFEKDKEAFAQQMGAQSFGQLINAAKKGLNEEALKKAEEEQAKFLAELDRDVKSAEEQYLQQRGVDRAGGGMAAARRMGRMV